MPSSVFKQRYLGSRSIHLAAIVAAALSAQQLAPTVALAGPFVEPPVFASSNGVLDLLMVALPLPVTSLTYVPPNNAPRKARDQPRISLRSARSPCTRASPVASARQASRPFQPSRSDAGPVLNVRVKSPRESTVSVPVPGTP